MCLVVILTQVDGAHNWLCRYLQASASPPPRVQTPTSSAGRATVSQPTASRPPHALLSTARARTGAQAVLTPPAQPEPAPSPPVAATAQADLFSLDFHAPAPSQEPQQPKKDAKADILSLFASTPAAQQQQQPVQSQFGGPTSMVGQNGTGMWGVQSGWAGTQASAPAADPWGSFSSAAPQSQVRGLFRAHKMIIPICSFFGVCVRIRCSSHRMSGRHHRRPLRQLTKAQPRTSPTYGRLLRLPLAPVRLPTKVLATSLAHHLEEPARRRHHRQRRMTRSVICGVILGEADRVRYIERTLCFSFFLPFRTC